MRIAYMLDWKGDPKTGVPQKVQDQIKIWEKNNGRVEIFAVIPKKYEKEWLKKTNRIFSYSSNVGRYISRIKASLSLMLSRDFDLAYRRISIWEISEIVSMLVVPTVLEINTNNKWFFSNKSFLLRLVYEIQYSIVSRIALGACAVTKELVKLQSPRLSAKTKAFTNSIDVENTLMSPLRKDDEKTKLIFVGSESFIWNGLDRLKNLAMEFPNLQFHVVGVTGTGPNNIVWYPNLYNESLSRLYEKIDIGISTLSINKMNLVEAAPLKSRNYLAHGLPVVGAYKDSAIEENSKFFMEIKFDPATDKLINKSEFLEFIKFWQGKRVIKSDLLCIESSNVERQRIHYFEHLLSIE
jgi:hypothetical protein